MDTKEILNNLHELTTVIAETEALMIKTLPELKDKYGTETFLNYVSIHGYFQGSKRLLYEYMRLDEFKDTRDKIADLYTSLIEK
jgi:hypothetical protein